MNFTLILLLSLIGGLILWGLPRYLYPIPAWGIKAFWIITMCLLLMFTQMEPQSMLIGSGFIGGMMIFESQFNRIKTKLALIKEKLSKGEKPQRSSPKRKPKKAP